MKKHKEKIKIGIVIGVFSVVIIACLVSIFSQVFTEYKDCLLYTSDAADE